MQQSGWRLPVTGRAAVGLGLSVALLLMLASSAGATSACQLVPRATVARVLGLPKVTTYSVSAGQCGLAGWSHAKPTIPASTPAGEKRLNTALRSGQVALLHVLVESGPSLEITNLQDSERTPLKVPAFGANGVRATAEVGGNADEIGAAWWWLNPPGSTPEIRQTLVVRIVQYHRSVGQLQKELIKAATVAVPAAA
jgi:hypothetical protein